MKTDVIKRIKAPTPEFFKKVIKIALSVGGMCVALVSFVAQEAITLSPWMNTILEMGIVASGVAAIVAKHTVSDSSEIAGS